MKYIKYIFIFFSVVLFSQNSIDVQLIEKTKLLEDNLVQIDNFNNEYFIGENALLKQTNNSEFIYNNRQLGSISSVDTFNPLKVNLF